MAPIDGLKKKDFSKIYRSSSRVNFLINGNAVAPAKEASPEEAGYQTGQPSETANKINRQANFKRPSEQKYLPLKIFLIIVFIMLISGAMYLSEKIFSPNGGALSQFNKFNPFARLAYLVTPPDKRLAGEMDDRINMLAMGMGGENHDGPYLTDTMIIISLKPSTGEVGLISLPRDLVVKYKDGGWYKINQIYSMGRNTSPEQGTKDIISAVEKNFGLSQHYYGIITFNGFEKFIDEIGGITVNVPNAFYDPLFPTKDFKTKAVTFEAGSQIMDGTTALTYARSRHGDNFEGSDFARSRRQQLILEAVKNKMFKFSTLFNPQKLLALLDLLGDSVETNLSIWQALKIGAMVKETGADKIYRLTLDDAPDGLLVSGISTEGAYILQPKNGNFEIISRQIKNLFNTGKIKEENISLEIQNGTDKAGLAFWTKVALEKLGYRVIRYSNAAEKNEITLIYDLNAKEKKNTLRWLKEELGAEIVKKVETASTESATENNEQADILIVLGNDYAADFKIPKDKPIKTATSTPAVATSTAAIETLNETNQNN